MVSGRQGEPNGYHNYHHLQFVPWSNYIVSRKKVDDGHVSTVHLDLYNLYTRGVNLKKMGGPFMKSGSRCVKT